MKNSDKNGKCCRFKTVPRILKIEQWLNERTYMKNPEIPRDAKASLEIRETQAKSKKWQRQ